MKELQRIKTMYETFIKKVSGNEKEELNYAEKQDFDIIKNALKRLEQLEEDFMSLTETNMELVQEQAKNQNKLKALEIIKNKNVDIYWVKICKTLEEYNGLADIWEKDLTQEEYDLLKEELL